MSLKYNPKLKERAKELRKNSTLSEVLLWNRLKRKQLKGYQFLRQKPIDNYIVDFFCPDLMLAIEIDGSSHHENEEYDKKREEELKNLGINIIRVTDSRVKNNIEGVVWEIEEWIDKNV
jgi:very-short-patch-repair endonuclease